MKVRVRIMVRPENLMIVKLYESLGFFNAGACTLEKALRANGDGGWIPQGTLPEKYTVKVVSSWRSRLNVSCCSSIEWTQGCISRYLASM